jgi:hypothetical protein
VLCKLVEIRSGPPRCIIISGIALAAYVLPRATRGEPLKQSVELAVLVADPVPNQREPLLSPHCYPWISSSTLASATRPFRRVGASQARQLGFVDRGAFPGSTAHHPIQPSSRACPLAKPPPANHTRRSGPPAEVQTSHWLHDGSRFSDQKEASGSSCRRGNLISEALVCPVDNLAGELPDDDRQACVKQACLDTITVAARRRGRQVAYPYFGDAGMGHAVWLMPRACWVGAVCHCQQTNTHI